MWWHLKKTNPNNIKNPSLKTQMLTGALRVIYQLEHIKFTVINSLLWESMVSIDVWSFICDVAHGALCLLLL